MRVGLAGEATPAETLESLLPTIRYDVKFESERIREAAFPDHFRMRERAGIEENTRPLAEFLDIPPDKAREIAASDHLFAD